MNCPDHTELLIGQPFQFKNSISCSMNDEELSAMISINRSRPQTIWTPADIAALRAHVERQRFQSGVALACVIGISVYGVAIALMVWL
jgi:hypothetical protein